MRYENEKKVKSNKIHTWDLLDEVDKLLEHIPNWKPFKWDPVTQQKYKIMYFRQFGGESGKKKKKI